jgi:DNA-binding transcriptional regulator YiaG
VSDDNGFMDALKREALVNEVCEEAANEIERLRNALAEQTIIHEVQKTNTLNDIQRLREELNTTQELLARCYQMAVGHGPDFDVFDTWEEAVSAYEDRPSTASEIERLRKALEQCIAERDTWRNLYDKERGAGYNGDDRVLHEPAGEVPKGKTRRI